MSFTATYLRTILPTSDGLQPTSNGLQPSRDGLQPNRMASNLAAYLRTLLRSDSPAATFYVASTGGVAIPEYVLAAILQWNAPWRFTRGKVNMFSHEKAGKR